MQNPDQICRVSADTRRHYLALTDYNDGELEAEQAEAQDEAFVRHFNEIRNEPISDLWDEINDVDALIAAMPHSHRVALQESIRLQVAADRVSGELA